MRSTCHGGVLVSCLAFMSLNAGAEDAPLPALSIARVQEPIVVDGSINDAAWRGASRIETWFETNPGDNLPPRVGSVGYLAYDDRFVYVGFEFEDPEPAKIRAPLGDRDNLPSSTDYAGVILDTRNDGRTGILFLANARGIQYDALQNDSGNGEDSSPDLYWDAAGRITNSGWTLEIRIPFTSLRYTKADPQTWGIMLYRNYPREFRYQMFSTRLPRGSSCFICNSNKLTGLSGLPTGGHLVAAPYASASHVTVPRDGLGSPLENGSADGEVGLDIKWTPSASTAIDATLNPDFSQIESDVAQIAANERFALFYSEKRPFFLEGIDLLSTPIQAVYTRTITAPRVGVRGTGKWGALAFTGLVADDEGGGQVILPGPNGSDFADQDFSSFVAVGRARRDFGPSFLSVLASDREVEGGGYNRVLGPDFQWRPNKRDTLTGQLLFSFTETPKRGELAEQWDGRSLTGHGADLLFTRFTPTYDVGAEYKDFGDDFRADNGFVPQVGFREGYLETGYTVRPTRGPVRRLRTYVLADYIEDREGDVLSQHVSPGFGLDARWGTFVRIRYAWDRVRAGEGKRTLPRNRIIYTVSSSPSRLFSQISLDGYLGGEVDFTEARRGTGGNATLGLTMRPTDHLELRLNEGLRWLDVDRPEGGRGRLFTARVDRLRATYTFTSRLFVRLIGQYVSTHRDPALYTDEVARHSGAFGGSLLFAYKLNWQTVLYAGYGDTREISEQDTLERSGQQLFLKLSYAFQR